MTEDISNFETALEHLRQLSKVYLPWMAEHYADAARAMTNNLPGGATSYGYVEADMTTAPFCEGDGGEAMSEPWTELAGLYTAALGHSGNTLWYTGVVLDWALDAFEDQDGVNADDLGTLQGEAEDSGIDKEHSGGYEPVDLPDYRDPSTGQYR